MNLTKIKKTEIEKQRLLLVEGKDEIMFFNALLKFLSIDNIQVLEVKGKEQFKKEIPKLKLMQRFSEVEKIGIVRDADENFEASLESVFNILDNHSFNPIKEHNKFSESNHLCSGIFIMPKLNSTGSLEDLCLAAIDVDEQLNCTNKFIDCVNNERPEIKHISKRKVQVYLSSQQILCNNLGLGAQKQYWNFESKVYDDIKMFINTLSS